MIYRINLYKVRSIVETLGANANAYNKRELIQKIAEISSYDFTDLKIYSQDLLLFSNKKQRDLYAKEVEDLSNFILEISITLTYRKPKHKELEILINRCIGISIWSLILFGGEPYFDQQRISRVYGIEDLEDSPVVKKRDGKLTVFAFLYLIELKANNHELKRRSTLNRIEVRFKGEIENKEIENTESLFKRIHYLNFAALTNTKYEDYLKRALDYCPPSTKEHAFITGILNK